jgi:DNA replication and repair protein RecF
MWLQQLSLIDIRSYTEADIHLTPGVTCFFGSNGQGKTNIIEMVGYLATLRSHRVATDTPLVREGCDSGIVRAHVVEGDRHVTIDLQITPGQANRARINRAAARPARDILGIVRVVIFAPEDLSLVKGDPSERRIFLDDIIIQRNPRMAGVRSDYERVVKQRSALLKAGSRDPYLDSTLDIWDEQLAALGAEITDARIRLVTQLQPLVQHRYEAMAGEDSVTRVTYQPRCSEVIVETVDAWRELLLTAVRDRRREEIQRGVTLVGPHRDDIELHLDGHLVKGYASHGESWSFALALRLASADVLRSNGVDPIVILDDVFAELDVGRRERLATMAIEGTQTLITAAVAEDIPVALTGIRYEVRGGSVTAQAA